MGATLIFATVHTFTFDLSEIYFDRYGVTPTLAYFAEKLLLAFSADARARKADMVRKEAAAEAQDAGDVGVEIHEGQPQAGGRVTDGEGGA